MKYTITFYVDFFFKYTIVYQTYNTVLAQYTQYSVNPESRPPT